MSGRALISSLVLATLTAFAPACVDEPEALPCDDDDAPWLLAIDEDDGTGDALIQISVEPGLEGEVTVLCEDLELPPGLPADTNFTSLSENHGYLYASAMRDTWGDTLVRIDPCACTVTEVGSYGFTLVSGLASNREGALFGLAAEGDSLIEIDPLTANAEARAKLVGDWDSNGLTYADGDVFYALDATGDRLHRFSARDGAPQGFVELNVDFAAAGVEYRHGVLYACGVADDDTGLYAINPNTGVVELVAESVFSATCDNLAGSSGPIYCGA